MSNRYPFALMKRTVFSRGVEQKPELVVFNKHSLAYTQAKVKPLIRPSESGELVIKYEVICDDQPKEVLLTMLALTKKEEE